MRDANVVCGLSFVYYRVGLGVVGMKLSTPCGDKLEEYLVKF